MPFPDPLATGYIVYGSDEKSPFVIVLHYYQQGTFEVDDNAAAAMATAMDAAFGATFRAWLPNDCQYFGCNAKISAGGIVYESSNQASAGAGSVAGQSCPDTVAAIIRKRTGVGGKSGRGRWYIGCVPEANQDTGKLTAAGLNLLNSLGTSLRTILTDAGGNKWISGHMSRKQSTVVPIVAVQGQTILGTQRRRRLRAPIL